MDSLADGRFQRFPLILFVRRNLQRFDQRAKNSPPVLILELNQAVANLPKRGHELPVIGLAPVLDVTVRGLARILFGGLLSQGLQNLLNHCSHQPILVPVQPSHKAIEGQTFFWVPYSGGRSRFRGRPRGYTSFLRLNIHEGCSPSFLLISTHLSRNFGTNSIKKGPTSGRGESPVEGKSQGWVEERVFCQGRFLFKEEKGNDGCSDFRILCWIGRRFRVRRGA